ncbi:MAG: OmpA family protein [Sandaracinus sp.]|nr:OmpA family protein [Sandaracinus sp.]
MQRRNLSLGVVLFALALPSFATAQRSATLNRFRASETVEDDFAISRPTDLGHLRYGAMLHLDYANDPLVWENELGERDSEGHRIVGHQLDATLGLSLGLFDRVVVFAGLPISLVMSGDDEDELQAAGIGASADGAGLGDAYLGARVRIYGESDDMVALGFQLTGTFPTAGSQRFRGDDFLSLAPELLFEVRPGGGARLVLDVGAKVRRNASDAGSNLSFGDELTFGLGFALPVYVAQDDDRTHVDVHAQVFGSSFFDDLFTRESTPFEGNVGAKLHHASGLTAGLAAGMGFTRGFGSPDARVIAMIGYGRPAERPEEPVGDRDGDGLNDDVDQCPDEPEDVDTFEDDNGCPDPDNDGDGILDASDECPMDPEDVDTFEDENGCPDPDNDGDGIPDATDQCPMEPEDADGFEDDNGCPDPDNDQDGVLDGVDACMNEPGPAANRGCPDPDRDGDTVVDRRDNCPDVAGPPENQGCPEAQQVRIEDGRLEILDVVYFRTNRDVIQRRSFQLLRNVAQVLNAHPEIERIRVEGHTDSRGRREANMTLSQKRAEAVVAFLVREGVAEGRLTAQGFGPDRPIVENAQTAEQHAQNRRVEFNIVNAGESIQQQNSGPSADTVDR